ncbi:MAG: hypothetical protein ACI9GH_000624 [Candidatus Paceibacteria bacterium]|jgi:hypothetical protein
MKKIWYWLAIAIIAGATALGIKSTFVVLAIIICALMIITGAAIVLLPQETIKKYSSGRG